MLFAPGAFGFTSPRRTRKCDPLTAAGAQSGDGRAAYVQVYLAGNQGEYTLPKAIHAFGISGEGGIARLLIPGLSRKIEEDRLPSAAMLAVIAVVSGTLAAASMTE